MVKLYTNLGEPPSEEESHSIIISETDLLGNIVQANDIFCKISGYRREELIGKSHNIIRHPDMPKALFQHLWLTIQQGEVFRAIIKNRKKDGSHYWVNSTIMPVFQGGQIVRYVGGRNYIKDDLAAEELFRMQSLKMGWM